MKKDNLNKKNEHTNSNDYFEWYSKDSIILLGYIGEREAYNTLTEHFEELHRRYSDTFLSEGMNQIKQAESSFQMINNTIWGNGIYAGKQGIYNALWELGCLHDSGLSVKQEAISIRQITIEMSNYFDFDPYLADSSCYLTTVGEMSRELYELALKHDIRMSVIGSLTFGNDRTVSSDGVRRYLTPGKWS